MTRCIGAKGTVGEMSSVAFGPAARPATLGQLRESGWESVPVKEEVRRNVAARICDGKAIVSGVVGYDDTVLPQLENALLAGHDTIFLGERGQAKTRIIRSLIELLDEWMPIVAGSEINDDPYEPVSRHARDLVRDHGEDTPIEWVHRSSRFGEKLATPDTSIADLIGEVDPIRVAEGRYLSDELTLHYGLVPRTNRGIFAINELPDLAERIQVGLLNVLEERDIQVRGYKIRLPLDVVLVASANPEDYTNREVLVANAARRALRHGEKDVAPRVSDLEALPASMMGKIEIEALEEGRDGQIAENLVKAAVLTVFKELLTPERFRPIVTAFEEGAVIHAGEDVTSAEYVSLLEQQPALREAAAELTGGDESAASVASAIELLLEGLHLSKRLN